MSFIRWDGMLLVLPAEQYALDTGNDPAEFTEQNINNFSRQIKSLVFPMIGIGKSIRQIQIITNGHNGSFYNFMKRAWLIWMKCQ